MVAAAFLVAASAGAVARALVGRALNREGQVAWGTLLVNVTGSFVLGLLVGVDAPAFTVLGTGLAGALTTFSSFGRDAVALAEERRWAAAAGYVLATCLMTVAAAAAGLAIGGG